MNMRSGKNFWAIAAVSLLGLVVAGPSVAGGAQGAGQWQPLAPGALGEKAFVSETEPLADGLCVRCTLNGLLTQQLEQEGQTFTRVSVPGLGVSGEVGTPELPAWRRFIEVPRDAVDVRLALVDSAAQKKSGETLGVAHAVYPVQPPWEKQPKYPARPPLAWDRVSYAKDTSVRPVEAELAAVGVARGRRLYMLIIHPIDYSPASHGLTVRKSVSVDVQWTLPAKSPAAQDERLRSVLFDSVLDEFVLNPPPAQAKGLPSLPIGYLIITAPAYAAHADLADFVAWKTQRGFHTTVVSTDVTGTTTTSIKAYIANAYATWGVPPTFVLLVGDTGDIPNWVGTETDSPATDLYYTTVDGSEWNTPDVYIGRFAVSSGTDLGNAIQKTLNYEQGLWPGGYTGWEQHAAFLAGNDNYSITEGTHNAVIASHLDPTGYTSDKLYEVTYGATTSDVTNAINGGRSLVTYSGHGSQTSWGDGPAFSQSNVQALTNGVHPFVMSFSCLTGSYEISTCFGETWLRDDKAGLAFCGSSVTSYWFEDDVFERGIFAGAFANDKTWLAGMLDYGKQDLYAHYGGGGSTHRYFEQYNLLGDPSVDLYMSAAGALTVSHASVMVVGAASFTVQVAQNDALVAVCQNDALLGAALSSGGSAVVTLSPPPAEGQAQVTVTRHNYMPYQSTVTVALGPAGVVSIEEDVCSCADTLHLSLTDSDLAGAGTQDVDLDTTGGDAETLTLIETATLGLFEGTIDTAAYPIITGNGTIEAAHGETITVTYYDADNGTGNPATVTDTATADCQAPLVSNVQVSNVTFTSAEISFDTDEPTTGRVRCGEVCGGPYAFVEEDLAVDTSHSITLDALAQGTSYCFVVDAFDVGGNEVTDDNGGTCYTFDTEDYVHWFSMDTDPGWITEGQWQFGQPLGLGGQYGNPDPTSGYTGSNVYGYNLSGDYANSISTTYYLTTTVLDCSGYTNIHLHFQRWLGVETPTYDHASVDVSNDGATWVSVWANSGQVTDAAWTALDYDISLTADDQPTVYIRWGMGPTDGSWQFCGWNIDDVGLFGDALGNALPEARNPTLTPDPPSSSDDLEAAYTYYDADGDPQAAERIRWYKNGVYQEAYANASTLPSSATGSGDRWYFRVRVHDGYDWGAWEPSNCVTVANRVPEVQNPTLTPDPAYADDALLASYAYYDADGDPEVANRIRWYKDGVYQAAYANLTVLPSSATAMGEQWYFRVRVCDGMDWSAWWASNRVSVVNRVPEVQNPTLTPDPAYADDALLASYAYYDADGDPEVANRIRWYKDGVYEAAYANLTVLPWSATAMGEQWYFRVRVFDGTDWSAWWVSNRVSVVNTVPEVQNPTLTPDPAYTVDALLASYAYYDADGHAQVAERIRWYKDGVYEAAYANLTVLPSSATAMGEQWYFRVRVFDGTDWSAWWMSNRVSVVNTAPEAHTVTLAPDPPSTGDDLTVGYSYYDAEGDPQAGDRMRWYRDGVHQEAYFNAQVVPAAATDAGEVWFCRVRCFDGETWGGWFASNFVTITAKEGSVDPEVDTDEDGIADVIEGDADSDEDGLQNWLDLDSDNDGVSDALEMRYGTDPYDAASTPAVPLAWAPIALVLLALGAFALRRARATGRHLRN